MFFIIRIKKLILCDHGPRQIQKKCCSHNPNITYVFILPSVKVLEKLWVWNVHISWNLFNFCSTILLSLKMVTHCINFLSEYSKFSRLETNLDHKGAYPKKNIGVSLTWGLELSCWNQNLLYFAFNIGRTSSFRNPQYFAMFSVPSNFRSSTSLLREIQSQTINEPPRNSLFCRLLVIFFAWEIVTGKEYNGKI